MIHSIIRMYSRHLCQHDLLQRKICHKFTLVDFWDPRFDPTVVTNVNNVSKMEHVIPNAQIVRKTIYSG